MPSTSMTALGLAIASHLKPYQVSLSNYPKYFVSSPNANSISRLVASAAVLRSGRVLLVQRAAHGFQPLLWELPGGRCESRDDSVIASAVRELREESGLIANGVIDVVGEYGWLDRGEPWKKITFLVAIEHNVEDGGQPRVTIDPEEQESFLWASEQDVIANACEGIALSWTSDQQRQMVLNAFGLNK